MLQTCITCGVWRSFPNNEWRFIVDEEKRARSLTLTSTTFLGELKVLVSEDYGIDQGMVDVEISYLPYDLIGKLGFAPVVVTNDRQVKNLIGYLRKEAMIQLCVTFKSRPENRSSRVKIDLNEQPYVSSDGEEKNHQSVRDRRSRVQIDLNEEPCDSSDGEKNSGKGAQSSKRGVLKDNLNDGSKSCSDDAEVDRYDDSTSREVVGSVKTNYRVIDCFKKHQHFKSKGDLQKALEMCAMKYNFDYRVKKSEPGLWCIRCKDNVCNWRVRAECLKGSTYFCINKYVAEHTCAPSKKSKFSRTASAKTIGHLIMHKYEGVKEGPKPNDIINIMRTDHGVELSYSKAWEAREYAVNIVRGIPEESFSRIPRYLHMLKEANPGTFTNYEYDGDGRFKYLFLSFGQCVRGFYNAIRRVIVIDGTFLKSKYKGTLLVATAVDGNSNLYPIAFGVVDTENDRSWEWFFMQLNGVIADDQDLAFVSDRHVSIAKSLSKFYPLARHGICIHHLLNNVVTNFKAKGLAGLVEKASKAYRVAEFDKIFQKICGINPLIGKYLEDADVRKWARCHFPGYRFDIRTTNPAESVNSALRSPREYPLIPLLDSIREMLTRWFYERRGKSTKHNDPLTLEVEKKVARRIEKAKKLIALPSTTTIFHVKGDILDYVVDLERRTCSCRKFELGKIPCRHAIKAAFSIGKTEVHELADAIYSTNAWRTAYMESINPIPVPEDEWCVPPKVEDVQVLPPESRRGPGRRRKRRYETAEDKIRSSQGSEAHKRHKCSRCHKEGHNRTTCDMPI